MCSPAAKIECSRSSTSLGGARRPAPMAAGQSDELRSVRAKSGLNLTQGLRSKRGCPVRKLVTCSFRWLVHTSVSSTEHVVKLALKGVGKAPSATFVNLVLKHNANIRIQRCCEVCALDVLIVLGYAYGKKVCYINR